MNWSDLSMKDRASYIKLMVENGIYNLNSIRTIYNSFAEGGPIKATRATPTLKKKSWETDEEYIRVMDNEVNAMHKMKEVWIYINQFNPGNEKAFKKIKKSHRLSEYRAGVEEFVNSMKMEK